MRRATRSQSERELLRQLKMQRKAGGVGSGLAYRGPADFVLQHGIWYEPASWPEGVEWGAPKMCYGNAITLAARFNWEYVEGYAVLPEPFSQIAIGHAWASNNGVVIDNTWRTAGACYLGVAFSPERGHDATWNGDACVLDDWKRGWPLLRTKWQGEDWTLKWTGSEVMDMLRRGDLEAVEQWLEDHAHELPEAADAPVAAALKS